MEPRQGRSLPSVERRVLTGLRGTDARAVALETCRPGWPL